MRMRVRHKNRLASIAAGKSNLDAEYEKTMLRRMGINAAEMTFSDAEREVLAVMREDTEHDLLLLDAMVDPKNNKQRSFSAETAMLEAGKGLGPIWDWVTGIRGLGAGGLAAQFLARIDDIGRFDTISKLWSYCGYGIHDGKIDGPTHGEKLKYDRRLKSILYVVMVEFIRMQTSPYAQAYYDEKERLVRIHPRPVCKECGGAKTKTTMDKDGIPRVRCADCGGICDYTVGHIDKMARRKVIKLFLSHLWVKWREFDGLPISRPYVEAILGHTHIIDP